MKFEYRSEILLGDKESSKDISVESENYQEILEVIDKLGLSFTNKEE